MIQIQPTHIGLDIAEKIMQELQPETPIRITNEFLELINDILNKSIGLKNVGLYRIANRILTLLPFSQSIVKRILKNNAQSNMDIYLIHLINDGKHCYCKPFEKESAYSFSNSGILILECSKITP